ncbi:MAG: cyclase family protein [Candidatus Cloacimonetes bacterium]|nr:cyclase family protein [Candidatus Cloacimonadota bacterium]
MDKYVLLSYYLNQKTPSYGKRDKFTVNETSQIINGDSANSSSWFFSTNHIGTHIDMPRHFFNNGKTVTDYSPEKWFFHNIQVINIPCNHAKLLNYNDFDCKINSETDFLLIKTGYGKYRNTDKYWNDNPGISPLLGLWLRENYKNIRAVGFDFISLTSWKFRDIGKKAHKVFLDPNGKNSPIWIIEDMNLSSINNNISGIIIAPFFVDMSNGSPVTIFGYKQCISNKL